MHHIDYRSLAIERLQSYPAQKASLEGLEQEIRMLEERMTAPRGGASSDATPVREGGNRYEDRLLTDIAKKEEMKWAKERACFETLRVGNALNALSDEQRLILDRFYMHRQSGYVERLCEELGYEKTQIYKMKDDALYLFTLNLYGVIEL